MRTKTKKHEHELDSNCWCKPIVEDYRPDEEKNEELVELGRMLTATKVEDKKRLESIINRLRVIANQIDGVIKPISEQDLSG